MLLLLFLLLVIILTQNFDSCCVYKCKFFAAPFFSECRNGAWRSNDSSSFSTRKTFHAAVSRISDRQTNTYKYTHKQTHINTPINPLKAKMHKTPKRQNAKTSTKTLHTHTNRTNANANRNTSTAWHPYCFWHISDRPSIFIVSSSCLNLFWVSFFRFSIVFLQSLYHVFPRMEEECINIRCGIDYSYHLAL